ncbi:MAG: tRNA epoxyqueuosine(34) reductase QueG, partial [Candidatus Sericytochromatia bacterium]
MEALKAALKAQAKALGLDLVGVCDAAPFEAERAYMTGRTVAPNPFEWPDFEARIEPERLLPGVKSIVAVGMSYGMPDEAKPEGLHGWLSRYCRGEDYHQLIEARMASLASWLEAALPGVKTYAHIDVGAPIDRAVAVRAGLGRHGKSTIMIAPGYGTWTFLGEILTTAPLPPDPPAVWNVCGSCTRCLDACPTGCLTEWAIDSTRCLGYLNQMDGAIPVEFRAPMGDRLFGCDDCQDVCPYNKTAKMGLHPEYAPEAGAGAHPSLLELLAMDESTFEARWGPTAAAWRGLETIQRNALVALGNSGQPEALEPLALALFDESPLLRRHAAWGLGRLAALLPDLTPACREALEARRAHEDDPEVLAE